MKPAAERLSALTAAGINPDKDIVVSCGGGVSCTSLYYGLKDII